jgi:hypothetical protein
MRGGLSLLVGSLGETAAHFPLYIAEALLVEGVALLVSARQRPLVFGAWCGVLIGTVGLAAEWGWSHVWMPLPWPAEILPQVATLGLASALAGSLIGAWIGARLGADDIPQVSGLRWAGVAGAVAMTAMVAYGLHTPSQVGAVAKVTLHDVDKGAERTAIVTARMIPPSAADGATWLTATAWQGGGLTVDRLREIRPGVYQSSKPIPIHGDYKALIRLHSGNSIAGLPIYAPADAAIPAPLVPAPRAFIRPFISDHTLLQREAKGNDPAIAVGAYGVIAFCTLVLLAMLAWGMHRIRATASPGGWRSASAPSSQSVLATPPAA